MTNALRPSELFALKWKRFEPSTSTMSLEETAYKSNIRPWGKTKNSLTSIRLPKDLATALRLWQKQCPDSSPDAFIFPNRDGEFLAGTAQAGEGPGLPKLTFQVIRRTVATLAQKKGNVTVQGVMRHSRTATTADVYMRPRRLPICPQTRTGVDSV
jgi:integrase